MGNSKKPSLKASFSKFQQKHHQDQLQKSKAAAKVDKLKHSVKRSKAGNSIKSKGKQLQTNHSTIIPFSPTDTILLVGEGNFSFTRALFVSDHPQLENLPPANVTATAYDLEEVCYEKYPDARDIVKALRDKGVNILFGIDATTMNSKKEFKSRKWKKIVWNFPHAGKGIADQDRNIVSNQILILNFLRCAADLLQDGVVPSIQTRRKLKGTSDKDSDDEGEEFEESIDQSSKSNERGTILITIKNAPPYTLWDVPSLAKKPNLSTEKQHSSPQPRYLQLRSFKFVPEIWKGYSHRMTKGWVEGINRGSSAAEDRTWEFYLAD